MTAIETLQKSLLYRFDGFRRLIGEEGIASSLWRGLLRHLSFTVWLTPLAFVPYQGMLCLIESRFQNTYPWRFYLSGFVAGIVTNLAWFPVFSNRVAAATGEKRESFIQLLKSRRRVLNTPSAILTAGIHRALFFGFFNNFRFRVNADGQSLSNGIKPYIYNFILAWATTAASGFATYWAEIVIYRLRTHLAKPNPDSPRNFLGTLKKILKDDGFFRLFRGGATTFTRGLTSASILWLYDIMVQRNPG